MPGLILFIFDLIIYYYYKFPMLYFPNRFFKEHILFIKYCSFWLFCFLVAYLIPNSGWFIWNIIGLNVDLIIFVIIGLFTIFYLKSIQPNLIKNKNLSTINKKLETIQSYDMLDFKGDFSKWYLYNNNKININIFILKLLKKILYFYKQFC